MLRVFSLWGVALFLLGITVSRVEANGCGGDGQACSFFKYTKCSSNVLDIGFILDRSGSVKYGIKCECEGDSCPVSINSNSENGCKRQDIMRIVMRIVLKKLFNKFSRNCYNYLESELFKATQLSCVDMGFTTPRISLIWWSDKLRETRLTQQWTKDHQSGWSISINDFLYDKNGVRADGVWERVNGEFVILDAAVDQYFDTILLEGSDYPNGVGGTRPSFGLQEWNRVVKDLWENGLTEIQKESPVFTAFLMTDGDINGNEAQVNKELANINVLVDELRNTLTEGKGIATYGLGLTGDSGLRQVQEQFFSDIGFLYETKVEGRPLSHFFSSEATANDVVEAMFDRITSGCQTCYRISGFEDKCTFGNEPPIFPGLNDGNSVIPTETQTREAKNEDVRVDQSSLAMNEFVKFSGDDTVFMINQSTTILCLSYVATNPDVKFVDYTTDTGQCKCCKTLKFNKGSKKCLCDYNVNQPISVTDQLVGSKNPVLRRVKKYNGNSRFASEIRLAREADPSAFSSDGANNDRVSDNETPSNADDGDSDTGDQIDTGIIGDGSSDANKDDDKKTDDGKSAAALTGMMPSSLSALLAVVTLAVFDY